MSKNKNVKCKTISGLLCMVLLLSAMFIAPMKANASGRIYRAAQGDKVYVVAEGGTDSLFVLEGTISFYVYVKGSNCAYISKSGNVSGVNWQGYKTVNGTKHGVYKITIQKTKAPKQIGTLTLANGNKRVSLHMMSAKTLSF